MKLLPDWIKNGYLRLIDPVANWLVRPQGAPQHDHRVRHAVHRGRAASSTPPGTSGPAAGSSASRRCSTCSTARSRGARTSSSTFGAFLDSTLDRLADGFVLGGLAVFYATSTGARQHPADDHRAAGAHRRVPHVVHARPRRVARARREGRPAAAARARRAPVGAAGAVRPRTSTGGCSPSSSSS